MKQENLQRNVTYNFWMAIIRTWCFCGRLPTGHLFLFLSCIYASNKCTSDHFGVNQTHRNRFLHLKHPVECKFPCKHCSLPKKPFALSQMSWKTHSEIFVPTYHENWYFGCIDLWQGVSPPIPPLKWSLGQDHTSQKHPVHGLGLCDQRSMWLGLQLKIRP